ncbi:2-hydroxyhepta-2,4-diene-1,7-dioate isomerase [Sandaracinomonas limnophila]|uniref:2-hydroxyhepta-2,4-diene-1,7-dioate isomerase n=1 Tax=Sandaracinomonas limnophila TaxID=1862386 RepID=A0A437PR17_9BACT|nr:fumarylacetoacetate hydrolase family protein [Sandaracinomonas limnophila]RVU24681.1 2-hydroxyhepta-2,4-diene-1,7-dioate isomerase [Sandaracinomonas limnophila]
MTYFKLFHTPHGTLIQSSESEVTNFSQAIHWDDLINQENLFEACKHLFEKGTSTDFNNHEILPPVGQQEIWAAGVTYLRSKVARMEESKESGGDTFYDKVYSAERPEIFYKGNLSRAVGNGGKVRIRKDAVWNVPEPELTLFINKNKQITAYTIGNDMSSRDIEGENPLYLPQAKVYDGSAGIGPCLLVPEKPLASETVIDMKIFREKELVFQGDTQISQMKRTHIELAEYLTRELSFSKGVFLMTGTCIVPDPPFTLQANDRIEIQIEPIGTLTQIVAEK